MGRFHAKVIAGLIPGPAQEAEEQRDLLSRVLERAGRSGEGWNLAIVPRRCAIIRVAEAGCIAAASVSVHARRVQRRTSYAIGAASTSSGTGKRRRRYTVRLTMQVEDRKGILAEVSSRIADINTNITNVEATTTDEDRRGRIDMTVEIRDLKHLQKVIKSLRGVEGVLDVERLAAHT